MITTSSGLVLSDLQVPLRGFGKHQEIQLPTMNFSGQVANHLWEMREHACYSTTSLEDTMTLIVWNTTMMPFASKALNKA
jgi:hypothetical protein